MAKHSNRRKSKASSSRKKAHSKSRMMKAGEGDPGRKSEEQ